VTAQRSAFGVPPGKSWAVLWAGLLLAVLLFQPEPDALGRSETGQTSHPLRLLILTGGHDFDEDAFFGIFKAMDGISWTHVRFPQEAEEKLKPEAADQYDVALFYDMYQNSEPHGNDWLKVLEKGKPTVFLHHALGSYIHWPIYGEILGGHANFFPNQVVEGVPNSTYKHDVAFRVHIADRDHPITRGLEDFDIVDETYDHYTVNPDVHVLLTVDHPDSGKVIAWTHTYKNSPIVYLQLGHGPSAYDNPNFRKILERSIRWVAGDMPNR